MAQSFFDKPPADNLALPPMLWTFLERTWPEWYVKNHICSTRWRHKWAVEFEGLWVPIDRLVEKVRERMKEGVIPVGDEWYSVIVKSDDSSTDTGSQHQTN